MAFTKEEQQIIKFSTENGKSVQEMKDAIFRYRTTGSPADTTQPVEEAPSLGERVAETVTGAGERVQEAIAGEGEFEGQTPVRRGVEATAEAFKAIPATAAQLLPEKARTGLEKVGEAFGKAVNFLGEKIGSTQVAQDFVTKHPEAAEDLEEVLGTIEAGGAISGSILAVEGGIKVPKKVVTVAKPVVQKAVQTSVEALKGITETGAKGIAEATAKATNPANIMQRVARISKGKQAKFESLAKESVGNYLVKRGIFGDTESITQQLFKRFTESKGKVDTAFSKVKGNYKNTSVGTALKQLLEKEQRVSSAGAPSQNLEIVRELSRKHKGGGLTMTEINQVKRLYERNVKLDFVKEVNTDGVAKANNIDSAIREWQRTKASEFGIKELKELNRETMLAKRLLDDLGIEHAGSIGNNAITLTDWIILAGGEPASLAGFLTKKALASQRVQAGFAKRLAGDTKLELPDVKVLTEPIGGYAEWVRSIEGQTTKQ